MGMISAQQRRNAQRETNSLACAGCDGPKQRGFPFCRKCTSVVVAEGCNTGNLTLIVANLRQTARDYAERLAFLLSRRGQQLRRTCGMVAVILAIALLASQQPSDTIAIILTPTSSAIILPREQAEQELKQLCADGSDDRRLHALAVALNPMPDWPQFVMNGDASVCNRSPRPVVPVPIEKQR